MLTRHHARQENGDSDGDNQPKTKAAVSADDLDLRARTTRPHSWIALVITAVAIAWLVAWSFLATIPQYTHGSGALTDIQSEQQVSTPAAGQVLEVFATPGQLINAGSPLFKLAVTKTPAGAPGVGAEATAEVTTIAMPVTGQVRQISGIPGSFVSAGEGLAVVAPVNRGTTPLYAVVFVSVQDSQAFQLGQQMPLQLDVGGSELLGTVAAVGELPATRSEITQIYSNPDIANRVFEATGGAPIAVTFNLGQQPTWVGDPAPYPLVPGMLVSVTQVTGAPHPISLLLGG